jgi:pimeloyl-ACP methyl ester carboxylesterase
LDQGSGPAILLLHGTAPGATAAFNFRSIFPSLTAFRVVAPDLIGFGASPNGPAFGIGPDAWQEQAWKALDERGIEQATVLGNATGGRIALEMAHRDPTRITGLILLSTRISPSQSEAQTLLREYHPDMTAMRDLLARCFATDESLLTDELVRERYEASARPGAHEAMQRAFTALRSPGLTAAQIGALDHPALVIHGRQDRVVPVQNSIELAEMLGRSDLHILADVGHWVQIERSADVNALIHGFLRRNVVSEADLAVHPDDSSLGRA